MGHKGKSRYMYCSCCWQKGTKTTLNSEEIALTLVKLHLAGEISQSSHRVSREFSTIEFRVALKTFLGLVMPN